MPVALCDRSFGQRPVRYFASSKFLFTHAICKTFSPKSAQPLKKKMSVSDMRALDHFESYKVLRHIGPIFYQRGHHSA